MRSPMPDCMPPLDMPAMVQRLSLLTPAQTSRWQGVPVMFLSTPEGAWNHRFTPPGTALSLLDEGSIDARISVAGGGIESQFNAGSLTLFNADLEVRVNQRGSHNARRVIVDLDQATLAQRGLLDDLVRAPLRPGCAFDDPSLAAVLREMVREIERGCPNGALFAESLSVGVALHLWRTRSTRPGPAARERGRLSALQWTRVEELIASELASDLSLSALSEALGLSKPHFVRLFRRTAGTSPHRYVMQRRIERARELIVASQVPLIDVASEAGFASQSHLNRLFRKTYGITPGDARRSLARTTRARAGND